MDGRNFAVSLHNKELWTSMGPERTIYCSQSSEMQQFYCVFPIRDALRPESSWSHYRLLIRIAVEK